MKTISALSRFVRYSLGSICLLLTMGATARAQELPTYFSNLASGSAGQEECSGWYEWVWVDEDIGGWEYYQECHWNHYYFWWIDNIQVTGTVPDGEVKVRVTFSNSSVQDFVQIATGGYINQNVFYTDQGPYPVSAYAFQINPNSESTWPSPLQAFFNDPDADFDEVSLYDPGDVESDDLWRRGSVSTPMAWSFAISLSRLSRAIPGVPGAPAVPLPPIVWDNDVRPAIQHAIQWVTLVRVMDAIKSKRSSEVYTYLTYEMHNTITNQYYVGRTSRRNVDPLTLLQRRMTEHARPGLYQKAPAQGWTVSRINSGHSTLGYQGGATYAMRGREQQLYDHHLHVASHSLANIDRPVALSNLRGGLYHATARNTFPPELYHFQGPSYLYDPLFNYIIDPGSILWGAYWVAPM